MDKTIRRAVLGLAALAVATLALAALALLMTTADQADAKVRYYKPGDAVRVTVAPGATSYGLAASMRRYIRSRSWDKHPTARAAAHGWEWPDSPWTVCCALPTHRLDCYDNNVHDDPPYCLSLTLDQTGNRHAGWTNIWRGSVQVLGNSPASYPGHPDVGLSGSYLNTSVAAEVFTWLITGDPNLLFNDCAARIGGPLRAFAVTYMARTGNQQVRPVVYIAQDGMVPGGGQPKATACVYSTPGNLPFNGPDTAIGIPSGSPTFYGVDNWG